MIKLESVSKNFKEKKVLHDISMEIRPGEITALIGLNGAGKSTLISMIMQYKKPDSGIISTDSVSVMPDAHSMIENMTGNDFLNFIVQLKNIRKDAKEQISKLARVLSIDQDLTKKIKDYSFGMKKKISFIQAYIGEFESYIFDEPTSGVDIESAQAMMELLIDLKNKDKAVLLTSHNLEELQEFSDYIYILKNGCVVEEGTIDDFVQKSNECSYLIQSDLRATGGRTLADYFRSMSYEEKEGTFIVFTDNIKALNIILSKIINDGGVVIEMKKMETKLRELVLSDLK